MKKSDLKNVWSKNFSTAPNSLEKIKNIKTAATAFNANIDAVVKVSGKQILKLINDNELTLEELSNIKLSKLIEPKDFIKGIFKCFSRGIAEEWLAEDKELYNWMVENIKYDKLQMGGQGGIVANILGVAGVGEVYAHTNSLPKLQAEQFLKSDNVLSFDDKGLDVPAYKVDRANDIPLIHWIIEFDKGDSFELEGVEFVCPKSNRFIATYDPLNLNLVKDEFFLKKLSKTSMEFIVLSGFHALAEDRGGMDRIDEVLPLIKSWKELAKTNVLHLEIASTQDEVIRKAIVDKVAPIADSVGVNERETIDILEVINQKKLAKMCDEDTHSVNLFKGILQVKKYIKCSRIQLHMFGFYITIQDKNFPISPKDNLKGMVLAATVAGSKAGLGSVDIRENLLWSMGMEVSDIGLLELQNLADYIGDEAFERTGISSFDGFDIIAIPTIIVENPITLVGMGDTISSISLVGAR